MQSLNQGNSMGGSVGGGRIKGARKFSDISTGEGHSNSNTHLYQNFPITTPNTPNSATEYGFPPMPEHLSEREKRQGKTLPEFDTIVVGGRRSTAGSPNVAMSPSTSTNLAPSAMGSSPVPGSGRKGSRAGAGAVSGGVSGMGVTNSPRPGRGSFPRGGSNIASQSGRRNQSAISTNGRREGGSSQIATSLDGSGFQPVHDSMAVASSSQHLQQYSHQTKPSQAQSGIMNNVINISQNVDAATNIGPQEGVMKMDDRNTTPLWSETKTKAGKERKRLPLACIACRRKKIRCSGEKPSCRHCLRSKVPCVYKQSARKAAPRTDYMAMLDRRMKKMEERLIRCLPKEQASAVVAVTGRSVVKPTNTIANAKKRTAEEAFAGDKKTAEEHSKRQQTKYTRANPVVPNTAVLCEDQPIQTGQGDDGTKALPSMELQTHLAEVYFEYLYGQAYFLLHKPSYMRRLREGQVPPVLVLSICAVAARFSNNPAVQHMPRYQAGTEYAEEATRLVLANFDNPNMTILTSLLLLGLHEFGTCQGGRSWSFGGMATRMAYALSLHKDPEDVKLGGQEPPKDDNPPYFSFMNRELRRRVMWACFSMDRFNSSGTQRLGMIIESDIEIPLPMNDSDLDLGRAMVTERLDGTVKGQEANARNNMGVAAYMIRVIALFGRVSKYLNLGGKEKDPFPWTDHNSQFAKLNEQVLAFPQSLPERLRYSDINLQNHADNHLSSQFLFIHIAYHHVRLFLHQFALPSSPRDVQNPAPEYVRCAKIAVDAATQISCMISKAAENGYKLVAPFMGYCAFTSSNVHLVRAFSKEREVQEQAEQHLSVNMKYLGQMKNWWGLFTHIYDTIRGQSRMYSDAGMQSTPTQNLQYGDWFQKYPQGVAEIPGTTSIRQIVPPLAEQKRNRAMDTCLDYRLDLMTAEEYFAKYGSATREKPAPTGVAGKTAKTTSTTSASTSTPMPQSQSNPRTIPAPISLAQATPTNIHHLTRRPQPISIPTARDKDLDSKLDPQLLNPMPPPPAPPQQAQPQTPRALTSPTYASEYTIAPNSPHNVTQYQSSIQSIQAGSSSSHSQSMSPTSYQSYSTPLLSPHQDDGGLTAHHHQLSHTHVQHQQIPAPQYQMYDSYSTPTPTATPTSTTGNGGEQNVLWEYADLSQDNNHHAGAHLMNSFADQTSTAWFVPFNLDHPAGGVSSDAGVGMTAYGHQLLEDEIGLRVGGMHTGLEIVGVGPVPEGGMQIHGHLMQQHQHQHERSHLQRGHMHVQHQNQTHHNLHLQPAYPPDPRYGHHGHHQQ